MATKGKLTTNKEQRSGFESSRVCLYCGYEYKTLKGNFQKAQSLMYKSNGYFLPWCNKCVDGLYNKYLNEYGLSEIDSLKRVCLRLDIYWSKTAYDSILGTKAGSASILHAYISKMNTSKYSHLSYEDTIQEEADEKLSIDRSAFVPAELCDDEVPQELIDFWGRGKSKNEYFDLQGKYNYLTKDSDVDDPATKMLVKQACLSEYEIDQLHEAGKPIEKQQASLINTLTALNLKPSQIKEAEKNSGLDDMPFGVGIQHWENTRPIPEVDESWKDVDKIRQYVMTWYTGATSKMFGVENEYTSMFNDAINEYAVEKLQAEEFDDIDVVSAVLNGGVE